MKRRDFLNKTAMTAGCLSLSALLDNIHLMALSSIMSQSSCFWGNNGFVFGFESGSFLLDK
jgi:hypothetical protein